MKKQSLILSAAIAATFTSSMAVADVSANIGVVSEYIFRGVIQAPGGSANGGFDYEDGNVSLGIWAADVGNGTAGIEYDLYGAYSGSMAGYDYSAGYTLYLYTGTFDTQYGELNLGTSIGPVGIDVAIGTHDNPAGDESYTFLALSGALGPVGVTVGNWSGDFTGTYLEFDYGTDIGGADASLILTTSSASATDLTSDGTSLVLSISKGFDL